MAPKTLSSALRSFAAIFAYLLFLLFLAEFGTRSFFAYTLKDPWILLYSGGGRNPNEQPGRPNPIGSIFPLHNQGGRYLNYWPGPLKMYIREEGGFSPYYTTINSLGFRTQEPGPRAPGELRIVCLGESSTFGFSLRDEETYPYQLQDILNRELSRPVKVFNLGVSESVSGWQAEILADTISIIKPDIVTFYGLHNDIRNLIHNEDKDLAFNLPLPQPRGELSLAARVKKFFLAPTVLDKWEERPKWGPENDLSQLHLQRIRDRVFDLAESLSRRGIDFYYVRQRLARRQEDPSTASYAGYYEWLKQKKADPESNWSFSDKVAYWHFPLVRSISEGQRKGLEVIDPIDALGDAKAQFNSHVHPSAQGAAVIASKIAEAILRSDKVKAKKP